MNSRPERTAVLLLLAVALGVRLAPILALRVFWFDEVYTLKTCAYPFGKIIHLAAGDVHPPVYYFLVRAIMLACSALDGTFEDIGWLRAASLIPGLLICLLAWIAARRAWGKGSGILALAFFALSPPLTFYSYELRSYSLTQLLLLASTLLLVALASTPSRRKSWFLALGYTACMALALYTHNISSIFLAAQSLIFLAEACYFRRGNRAYLFQGLASAAALSLLYLPWVPTLLRQNQSVNRLNLPWLPAAQWEDLASTLFYFLPCGPFENDSPWSGWPLVTLLGIVAMFVAGLAATLISRHGEEPAPPSKTASRLLVYCIAMTLLPLAISFALSHWGAGRIFKPTRYNFLCSPFWSLAVVGLMIRIRPSGVRQAFVGAALAISLVYQFRVFHQRAVTDDLAPVRALAATDRLYWLDGSVLPWLHRAGALELSSYDQLSESQDASSEPVWLMSHKVTTKGSPLADSKAALLETLLLRDHTAERVECADCQSWAYLWKMEPVGLMRLKQNYEAARARLETRRASIAGGQVILADDRALRDGIGWGTTEYDDKLNAQAWTIGDHQVLDWTGPERPGTYRIQFNFWRTHAYPNPADMSMETRLPGQPQWTRIAAPLGPIHVVGEFTMRAPRERLHAEFRIPSWIPAERIAASDDIRRIGIVFTSLEITP